MNVFRSAVSTRRRSASMFFIIFFIMLAIDYATKLAVEGAGSLALNAADPLIPSVLGLALVHNTGAAWGIFSDSTTALGVISLVLSAAVAAYALIRKDIPPAQTVACALIASGGIGNAIDRFSYGYVVDFIQTLFIDFPVFNVADICVTCGVILLIIAILLEPKPNEEACR